MINRIHQYRTKMTYGKSKWVSVNHFKRRYTSEESDALSLPEIRRALHITRMLNSDEILFSIDLSFNRANQNSPKLANQQCRFILEQRQTSSFSNTAEISRTALGFSTTPAVTTWPCILGLSLMSISISNTLNRNNCRSLETC